MSQTPVKHYHTHKDVPDEDMNSPNEDLFALYSHSSDDLTRWFQHNILRVCTNPTNRQKEASERFLQHITTWKDPKISLEEDGQIWFSLFDQLFFFGSLSSRTDVTFSKQIRWCRFPPGSFNLGEAVFDPDTERCQITIYPHWNWSRQKKTYYKTVLGTLLHECCHAIGQLYCCAGDECLLEIRGFGVHGKAWQKIARACEETLLRRFSLDVKLDVWSIAIVAEHFKERTRERLSHALKSTIVSRRQGLQEGQIAFRQENQESLGRQNQVAAAEAMA